MQRVLSVIATHLHVVHVYDVLFYKWTNTIWFGFQFFSYIVWFILFFLRALLQSIHPEDKI